MIVIKVENKKVTLKKALK